MRTLGSPFVALLLQAQSGAVSGDTGDSSILGLIASATPISQGVLLILALLSVGSWAIILYKLWVFRRSEHNPAVFSMSSAAAASSLRFRRSAGR